VVGSTFEEVSGHLEIDGRKGAFPEIGGHAVERAVKDLPGGGRTKSPARLAEAALGVHVKHSEGGGEPGRLATEFPASADHDQSQGSLEPKLRGQALERMKVRFRVRVRGREEHQPAATSAPEEGHGAAVDLLDPGVSAKMTTVRHEGVEESFTQEIRGDLALQEHTAGPGSGGPMEHPEADHRRQEGKKKQGREHEA